MQMMWRKQRFRLTCICRVDDATIIKCNFQVYEIWKFGTSMDVRTDLFADYVNTLLKYKVQYGGFPSISRGDKTAYLKIWRERENIDIKEEDVSFNPAYYVTVKRFLNSLWG